MLVIGLGSTLEALIPQSLKHMACMLLSLCFGDGHVCFAHLHGGDLVTESK